MGDATTSELLFPRCAGVLLHPTSLPGPHGTGALGQAARRFIDWLAMAGVTRWQVLPLVPPGAGWSPYSTPSALAGNPWLIDLDELVREGLLDVSEVGSPDFPLDGVEFEAMRRFKEPLLRQATRRLVDGASAELGAAFADYRRSQGWLGDAALFAAVHRQRQGAPWWEWPEGLRERKPKALDAARKELAPEVDHEEGLQFLFEHQWQALRSYAHDRGVQVIGDLPIYVNRDSVDVWTAREQFRLDGSGHPVAVAGVPPDYFSETGQLWGNPLYDWDRMEADGFRWWVARLARTFEQVDVVRIDHFRAFAAYWEVPADAPDARGGQWVQGPGRAFFDAMRGALGDLPIIAEDLGILGPDVHVLRDAVGLPGMSILQFAFGDGPDNHYLPHNHRPHSVAYSGTHDNDTTEGWWAGAPEHVRDHVRRYLSTDGGGIAWTLLRTAMASVAHTAIVPLQDVLGLSGDARMNVPGRGEGNWSWRVRADGLNPGVAARVREVVTLYGR